MYFLLIFSEDGLTLNCTDCPLRDQPAKRIKVEGKIRLISIDRVNRVSGHTIKSKARVNLDGFNILCCIMHFG